MKPERLEPGHKLSKVLGEDKKRPQRSSYDIGNVVGVTPFTPFVHL